MSYTLFKPLVTMQYPHFESGEQRSKNNLQNLLQFNQSPSCVLPLCFVTTFILGMATQCSRRWNNIKEIPDEIGGDL